MAGCRWVGVALVLLSLSALAQDEPLRSSERLEIVPQRLEGRLQEETRRLLPRHLRLGEPRVLGDDRLRRLPTPVAPAEESGVQRRILADGTFETRYPDGRIQRQRPDGSIETVAPDGTVSVALPMQVQSADLPLLPDDLREWGSELGDQLLGLLGNLLSDAEFEAYRQTEAGKDYYELVDWRLRSLHFLTAAE